MSDGPITAEGVVVEEAQSADGLVEAAPGALLFFDEIDLVGADVFGAEVFGRPFEVAGEKGDAVNVGFQCPRGVVAQTEVFEVDVVLSCNGLLS